MRVLMQWTPCPESLQRWVRKRKCRPNAGLRSSSILALNPISPCLCSNALLSTAVKTAIHGGFNGDINFNSFLLYFKSIPHYFESFQLISIRSSPFHIIFSHFVAGLTLQHGLILQRNANVKHAILFDSSSFELSNEWSAEILKCELSIWMIQNIAKCNKQQWNVTDPLRMNAMSQSAIKLPSKTFHCCFVVALLFVTQECAQRSCARSSGGKSEAMRILEFLNQHVGAGQWRIPVVILG